MKIDDEKNLIPPQIFNASDVVFQVTQSVFSFVYIFSSFNLTKFFPLEFSFLKFVFTQPKIVFKNIMSLGQNNLVKLMGIM